MPRQRGSKKNNNGSVVNAARESQTYQPPKSSPRRSRASSSSGSVEATTKYILSYIRHMPKEKQVAVLALLLVLGGTLTLIYLSQMRRDPSSILTDPAQVGFWRSPCTQELAGRRLFDPTLSQSSLPRHQRRYHPKPPVKISATKDKAVAVEHDSASSPVPEAGVDLRTQIASKIVIDTSQGGGDMQDIKENLIDFFLNTCDERMLYLINTPVKLILTHRVFMSEDQEQKVKKSMPLYHSGYVGVENEIRLFIPSPHEILAQIPGHFFPYDYILRSIRHEQFHAMRTASASDASCQPNLLTLFQAGAVGGLPLTDISSLQAAIKQGDERIISGLGELIRKRNAGILSPAEKTELTELAALFKHYVPRRNIAVFSSYPEKPILDRITSGKPYEENLPGYLTLYIDMVYSEINPDTGKHIYLGQGHHVKDPTDKLAAIVKDTEWKIKRIEKMDVYAYKIRESTNPAAKLVTELEAFTIEMGPEVVSKYYPELQSLYEARFRDSDCLPLTSTASSSSSSSSAMSPSLS